MDTGEMEIAFVKSLALRNVANRIGVLDAEFKLDSELLMDIQGRDNVACRKLNAFFKALRNWSDVFRKVQMAGEEGRPSKAVTKEMNLVTSQKDLKRRELTEYLSTIGTVE